MTHTEPRSAEEVKAFLGLPVDSSIKHPALTNGLVGALTGHLQAACGGTDKRHAFLQYVFDVPSSRDLYADQWVRLWLWLDPKPFSDEGGAPAWLIAQHCYAEAKACVIEGQKIHHQQEVDRGQTELWSGTL